MTGPLGMFIPMKQDDMTETSRRHFLQYGLAAGAALGVTAARPGTAAAGSSRMSGRAVSLRPFAEPLPVPGSGIVVASPVAPNRYHFTLRQISRRLHPQLPKTPILPTTTALAWAVRPGRSAWP
jgi:hypothetical protein